MIAGVVSAGLVCGFTATLPALLRFGLTIAAVYVGGRAVARLLARLEKRTPVVVTLSPHQLSIRRGKEQLSIRLADIASVEVKQHQITLNSGQKHTLFQRQPGKVAFWVCSEIDTWARLRREGLGDVCEVPESLHVVQTRSP